MAANEANKAYSGHDETHTAIVDRTLQLLRCKRQFSPDTELLEVRRIHVLPNAQSQTSKEEYDVEQIPKDMGLLCEEAARDEGHLELGTEAGLKSRMRENRTCGSVRGIRQAFHVEIL